MAGGKRIMHDRGSCALDMAVACIREAGDSTSLPLGQPGPGSPPIGGRN